jgi:hypothetical protein
MKGNLINEQSNVIITQMNPDTISTSSNLIKIKFKKLESSKIQTIDPGRIYRCKNKNLKVGSVLYWLREQLNIQPENALFIQINNVIPSYNQSILDLYSAHASPIDNCLYITYFEEHTFG